ncbi:uncharacterized protein LOC129750127 [Uranotaenia lowii]|uniref:uncharacterized protein LOC129750127 n=1 Tax=Uranotaenia lowii TaxID=190385 RepID=UPI00247A727D|nr:uncharacterized protein LOC129750127 [Uranotaenia lowii]
MDWGLKMNQNPKSIAQLAIVLASVVLLASRPVESAATGPGKSSGSSSLSSSTDSPKDLNSAGNFWNPVTPPQAEYYHDRYSSLHRPDRDRTDFVTTSFGNSYDSKYGGGSSSLYGSKDRVGFSPFSSGGSYYSSGGVFDRKQPPYGPATPIDYPPTYAHEYDTHYDYQPHGHGYSIGHSHSGKDIAKSVLIPLAGAALLGIAAALVANPVLLHLGAVGLGKRKRRDVSSSDAHHLAYRAQIVKPTL